ncbi:MAG: hypothetical protein K9M51_02295 [Candidatus Gracilibacteria bacterium]|nr:hypothetical protein [Candidatus Gracilibacteria bacterium]
MSFWKNVFGNGKGKKSCCCCSGGSKLNPVDAEILKTADPKIVVGKILEISDHPDPSVTKVRITQTEIAPGKTEQILCGGVNIREGAVVPVATIGAKLGEDFEIGERAIRGQTSRGMICSREELGLDKKDEPEHGIWILPEEMETFVGKPLREI